MRQYRHQDFQFPLWYTVHLGTESEHQVLNGSHIFVSITRVLLLERFSITFTANGKRQAEISRLPKTREIYLVSGYILPVSHSYGASTKHREIS